MISVSCDRCHAAIVDRAKRLILFGWRGGYRTETDQLIFGRDAEPQKVSESS
jgi:hypothetical protein